jgi:hypothetical protein
MKVTNLIILCLTSVLIFSCATQGHKTMRGVVVMKTGPDLAHVCLGNNEVKVGDRVTAYKHVCKYSEQGNTIRSRMNVVCNKEKIGNGSVVAALDEHYSEV